MLNHYSSIVADQTATFPPNWELLVLSVLFSKCESMSPDQDNLDKQCLSHLVFQKLQSKARSVLAAWLGGTFPRKNCLKEEHIGILCLNGQFGDSAGFFWAMTGLKKRTKSKYSAHFNTFMSNSNGKTTKINTTSTVWATRRQGRWLESWLGRGPSYVESLCRCCLFQPKNMHVWADSRL